MENTIENLAWMVLTLWASLYVCLYIVIFGVRGRTEDLRREISELHSELCRLQGN